MIDRIIALHNMRLLDSLEAATNLIWAGMLGTFIPLVILYVYRHSMVSKSPLSILCP